MPDGAIADQGNIKSRDRALPFRVFGKGDRRSFKKAGLLPGQNGVGSLTK